MSVRVEVFDKICTVAVLRNKAAYTTWSELSSFISFLYEL